MTDTYRAKRVSLQVWIDEDLRHRLKVIAAQSNSSITDIVTAALERIVTGHEAWIASQGKSPESLNVSVQELADFLQTISPKK